MRDQKKTKSKKSKNENSSKGAGVAHFSATPKQVLTREKSRGILDTPVVAEPVVAPVPLTIAPIEATDIQVTARVLKDYAPAGDVANSPTLIPLPRLWNEVRILTQCIHNVWMQG